MWNSKGDRRWAGGAPSRRFSSWFLLPVWGACLLAGCRQDMHNLPRYEPYEQNGMRAPVEGTVGRGSLTPAGPPANAPAGAQDFPFAITPEVLARGQERYNIS